MIIRGKARVFGDDIDTDAIIPARYLNTSDPAELAQHCLEGAATGFPEKEKQGDIIIAGKNFGCGSSREHAPLAIKASGVGAIVATSFARIFYRNAFNIGLPIFESPEAAQRIGENDSIEIDSAGSLIRNLTTGEEYRAAEVPPFMSDILAAGGLIEYLRRQVKNNV
ncbi:MAG TPA: 3-isopropylmalate dehydratase small subunit [Firmicutes bacterium]|nr:3-isopropylmalate dehydratase small subunit [Bacillota bacterium]